MNEHRFAKHEGFSAKHLPLQSKKVMQINRADVAELVDARDLKALAVTEINRLSCKTWRLSPVIMPTIPSLLQNSF
jgi:hypothetical protein